MGCDNYLFKQTYVSDKQKRKLFNLEFPSELIIRDKIWHETSWRIGEAFAVYFDLGDGNQWTTIDPEDMKEFAEELHAEWKEDKEIDESECDELAGLIRVLKPIKEIGNDETYFFTMDY